MSDPIKFFSTNLKSEPVTFRQALLKGQAPDKGLYLPGYIPVISPDEILGYASKPYWEVAFEVTRRFLRDDIPGHDLAAITRDAYNYPVPLELVHHRRYILRLDQGPTASFKDFAARMMSRLMQYCLRQEQRRLLILTATSGDTGSAVANAFYGMNEIDVVVLFPRDEVTARQRKQMTTLGKNVRVLALNAKFDDCQSLVKKAFADPDLASLDLSSANSINIGRLIPQIVYYFYSYACLMEPDRHPAGSSPMPEKAVFSVPSGNFGDMMGGVLAMKMGLPVKKFVIATNENDEFPVYLSTGTYRKIEPSRNCISSAMNVGHPSNLARLVALYGGAMDESGFITRQADLEKMRNDLWSVSITDEMTRKTIESAYRDHGILLEPHGAVGWAGLTEFLSSFQPIDPDDLCISLETAHPAKFPEEIEKILHLAPGLPASLEGIDNLPEYVEPLENNYQSFKGFLQKTYS